MRYLEKMKNIMKIRGLLLAGLLAMCITFIGNANILTAAAAEFFNEIQMTETIEETAGEETVMETSESVEDIIGKNDMGKTNHTNLAQVPDVVTFDEGASADKEHQVNEVLTDSDTSTENVVNQELPSNDPAEDLELFLDTPVPEAEQPGVVSPKDTIPEETLSEPIADFTITVNEDISQVKAGQSVGYEILLENTGTVNLEQLELRGILDNGNIHGEWLATDGLTINSTDETAALNLLEAGSVRTLVLMVAVPEERQENLEAEFLVKAENPLNEMEIMSRSASLSTKITPLTVGFTVNKWADRSVALPGDTITYQICIRNTGERALHSVLTTEKFQEAGLQAAFQEKEGVILNGAKTQALIAEIKPGEAFGLYATVTLPENFAGGDILNEVTVVTKETGESSMSAGATVEVAALSPTEIPVQRETETQQQYVSSQTVKEIPQTADLSETELWAGAFGISCLIIIGIYWMMKAKRKH